MDASLLGGRFILGWMLTLPPPSLSLPLCRALSSRSLPVFVLSCFLLFPEAGLSEQAHDGPLGAGGEES